MQGLDGSVIPKRMRRVRLVGSGIDSMSPEFRAKAIADAGKDPSERKAHEEIQRTLMVEEVDTPIPRSGEVLVRMECSPINPSDLATAAGAGHNKASKHKDKDKDADAGVTPGYEGAGTVVLSGGGFLAWLVSGKRVAVVSERGCWCDYVVAPATQCLPLPDDVSFEQGCSCFVNPMTAMSFIEIAQSRGLTSMVHTAASSQLGKMLIRLGQAARPPIRIIGVVRRPEQVKELIEAGVAPEDAVCSGEEGWREKLSARTEALNCKLAFDCVSGEMVGHILAALPSDSEVQVYGDLSRTPVGGIVTGDLLDRRKRISGFYLANYLRSKWLLSQKSMIDAVARMVKNEVRTEIRARYPLEQAGLGITEYVANMSAGKVVLVPSLKPQPQVQPQPQSEPLPKA